MRNLLLFLHLAAAIFWMGGMAFLVLALRPVVHAQLQPPVRLPLMQAVLGRFFVVVTASIAVLLATGGYLLMADTGVRPPGWEAMAWLGAVMVMVFGYIVGRPYPRMRLAVAAQDWPAAGRQVARITLMAKVNLGLGWLAIAAVLLWR
jgi:uncharacterized membrane protein